MEKETDAVDQLVSQWKQERAELDVDAMHLVGRIIKLGKIFEKQASAALKDSGIHYTDLDVLATIRRSGPPYLLTPKELMASVLLTSGAMTALLNRLTKLELIYRCPDDNDGRIILAGLTPKGIEIIDKAISLRFNEAKDSVEIFNQTERLELETLLRKLLIANEKQAK